MNEKIKLERVKSIRAAYFHALSEAPESDAWKKAESWAKEKGLLRKDSDARIFGRNAYPTKDPEPHGYGYFITITPNITINEKESQVQREQKLYELRSIEKSENSSKIKKEKDNDQKNQKNAKYRQEDNKIIYEKYDKNGELIFRMPPKKKPLDELA